MPLLRIPINGQRFPVGPCGKDLKVDRPDGPWFLSPYQGLWMTTRKIPIENSGIFKNLIFLLLDSYLCHSLDAPFERCINCIIIFKNTFFEFTFDIINVLFILFVARTASVPFKSSVDTIECGRREKDFLGNKFSFWVNCNVFWCRNLLNSDLSFQRFFVMFGDFEACSNKVPL